MSSGNAVSATAWNTGFGAGTGAQPAIAASNVNPSDLAVASQNGLEISTNHGASWSAPIPFPSASGGDSSVTYDKTGDLDWSYLNPITGGITMLLGRFAPEIFALGLAGSLARQSPVPASAGTLDTRTPLFVGMLVGVILILVGLTYFPALALGVFAEGLH